MEITITIDKSGIYTIAGGRYYMQFDSTSLTQQQIEQNIQIAEGDLRWTAQSSRTQEFLKLVPEVEAPFGSQEWVIQGELRDEKIRKFEALAEDDQLDEIRRLSDEKGL